MVEFGRSSGCHLVQTPAQAEPHTANCPRTMSRWFFSISEDRDSITTSGQSVPVSCPRLPQPLLIAEMLQTLCHLCGPLLDSVPYLHAGALAAWSRWQIPTPCSLVCPRNLARRQHAGKRMYLLKTGALLIDQHVKESLSQSAVSCV